MLENDDYEHHIDNHLISDTVLLAFSALLTGVALVIVVVVVVVVATTSVLEAEIDTIAVGLETVLSTVVLTDIEIVFAMLNGAALIIAVLFMHVF